MEAAESSLLNWVHRPGLAGVKKRAQNAGFVHLHFCADGEIVVTPYSVLELAILDHATV